jgi:hypothetical protein
MPQGVQRKAVQRKVCKQRLYLRVMKMPCWAAGAQILFCGTQLPADWRLQSFHCIGAQSGAVPKPHTESFKTSKCAKIDGLACSVLVFCDPERTTDLVVCDPGGRGTIDILHSESLRVGL